MPSLENEKKKSMTLFLIISGREIKKRNLVVQSEICVCRNLTDQSRIKIGPLYKLRYNK